jgi:glucose/mannose-6-phosphate isomerase
MSKTILDNRTAITKLDSKNMLGSVEQVPEQVGSIFQESKKFEVPALYKKIGNVVIAGMGGSTLGSHIIKSLFFKSLSLPFEVVNGYHLPGHVNEETLVVISSYSGTTEETLASLKEAVSKKAKVIIFTSGGELKEQAELHNIPVFIFSTTHNPCGSPRMGLGYSIVGQMLILAKAGVIAFSKKDIEHVVQVLKKYTHLFGVDNETIKNTAKQIAQKILGRSVWFMGSEHLAGNTHVGANQMNENAKRFAGYFIISELNHHLLEGMMLPKSNPENLVVIFLKSKLYDTRIQKRYEITEAILKQNNILYISHSLEEETLPGQVSEALIFTSYLSYYSALLEEIDPTAIPFVDYFKEQLKK